MSAVVTDPNNTCVSPTRRAISSSISPMRSNMACAACLLFVLLGLELAALALDVLPVADRDEQRQLARQQIVARVAVGDFHDLATPAEIVHVFSQNHFHDSSS